ncbi:MAG: ABC transporter ATP-binding protein [Anaerolineae bacterium]
MRKEKSEIRNPKSEIRNRMPLLEGLNLTKRFNGLVAVENVSLEIAEREIVGLLGPNGSGKTTLINLIAGRVQPTAGTVRFAGRDITHLPAHERCHLGLARTFQTVKPFDHLSVLDNVAAGAIYGNSRGVSLARAREEAVRLLEVVDLAEKAGDLAGTLSMGQRKRLELARALATRPRLLLLDEVGAGLTPAGGIALRGLLARLRDDGLTILGVEHALHALADIVDRLIVLDRGRVITDGPPEVVLDDPQVMDAYMGE